MQAIANSNLRVTADNNKDYFYHKDTTNILYGLHETFYTNV